jgi:hypothetical protein
MATLVSQSQYHCSLFLLISAYDTLAHPGIEVFYSAKLTAPDRLVNLGTYISLMPFSNSAVQLQGSGMYVQRLLELQRPSVFAKT